MGANNGIPKNRFDPTMNIWINTFAINKTSIFAATDDGSVFLSIDDGNSWNIRNTGLSAKEVWAFAVSDTNIFAGTFGGNIFLSKNYGASWNRSDTGLTVESVSPFLFLAQTYL